MLSFDSRDGEVQRKTNYKTRCEINFDTNNVTATSN